jgi:hypothetical protein
MNNLSELMRLKFLETFNMSVVELHHWCDESSCHKVIFITLVFVKYYA